MASSSSTLSSDGLVDPTFSRFLGRLAAFFALPAIACLVVGYFAVRSGELLPVRVADWAQRNLGPMTYLPKISDHNYRFKLEATLSRRPDVLALGSSRMNQWRSAMFHPQTFYNAGNSAYTTADLTRFVTELGAYSPKVLIFPVDFYMFDPNWAKGFDYVEHGDVLSNGSQAASMFWGSLYEFRSKPLLVASSWKDPVYGIRALGLQAVETGIGFREDGSLQYGNLILGNNDGVLSMEGMLKRVASGEAPVQFADRIDPKMKQDFQAFVAMVKARGIVPIGVTMPIAPLIVQALNTSPRHGIWREFRTAEFRDWIAQTGVTYFDFTDDPDLNTRTKEFVDPIHASEPYYARLLAKMVLNPDVARALSGVSADALDNALKGATELEVYRNQF